MARKHESSAAETLDEIESLGDRLVGWVSANPAIVLGSAIGVLVLAAGYGFVSAWQDRAADKASAELARVDADYRKAMGASPNAIEIPEPANPETARDARTEYLAEYQELAKSHGGSAAGAMAALEAGQLQEQLGDPEAALETWREAALALDADEPARGLLYSRIAAAHEDGERWAEAAEAYEAAAAVGGYRLTGDSLAEAARCWAQAGEPERAIAAFDRLAVEAPAYQAPEHIRVLMAGVRASQ